MKRQATLLDMFKKKQKCAEMCVDREEGTEKNVSSSSSRASPTNKSSKVVRSSSEHVTSHSKITAECASETTDKMDVLKDAHAVQMDNELIDDPTSQSDMPSVSTPWPSVWDSNKWEEKKALYSWLDCKDGKLGCTICANVKNLGANKEERVSISEPWKCYQIEASSAKRCDVLSAYRVKIKRHNDSFAHKKAKEIIDKQSHESLLQSLQTATKTSETVTARIFRTAYHIAKSNRPYSDHPELIKLQNLNCCDVGLTLHSRFSATEIIKHIAQDMKAKIVRHIVENNCKLVVLVDESTNLSRKSCLLLYLRTVINESEPIFIQLGIVELPSQDADTIVSAIEKLLIDAGFTKDWLVINFIGFVSDGASVLVGKKNGVAKKLKDIYPNIFSLHCMNHRLELAVADVSKHVKGINKCIEIVESIASTFNQSPESCNELSLVCQELEVQFLKIGKILDVRWVASSFRTVEALWKSYPALVTHFDNAGNDRKRLSSVRSKCQSLSRNLKSPEFVENLGLLYDVLQELSTLSLELQRRDMSLFAADKAVRRTICVLKCMKDSPGQYTIEARGAVEAGEFKKINLKSYKFVPIIHYQQFFQSIIDNVTSRLCDDADGNVSQILSDSKVLNPSYWPEKRDIVFGEAEIRRLCERFNIPCRHSVEGMREYIDDSSCVPNKLKPLKNCIDSLASGTAECERGFSQMNLIVTDLRTSLTISNLGYLMFLNVNGPPIELFNPSPYSKSWMLNHRSADDNRTRKVQSVDYTKHHKKPMWDLLKE